MEKIKIEPLLTGDLDSFINQSFKDLSLDPLLKSEFDRLKVTENDIKENIATFLNLQEDEHYCKACPGLDLCEKSQKHFLIKIERNGRFLTRSFNPCPVLMKKMDEERLYKETDFPETWRQSRFASLSGRQSRVPFISASIAIIKGASHRWLYLNGKHHTGKSFLLATFLNEFLEAKKGNGAYINSSSKLKNLLDNSIENKATFKKDFDFFCEVPLLVIDEFGNEYKSEYMRDQVLFPLLIARSKSNLVTCFTSDFSISDIGDLYSSLSKSTTRSSTIRAQQLVSLLKDNCVSEIIIEGVPDLY